MSSHFHPSLLIFTVDDNGDGNGAEVGTWRGVSDAAGPRASIALRVLLPLPEEERVRSAGTIVTVIRQWSFAGSIPEPSDFGNDGTSGCSRLGHGRCILSGDDARSQNPAWTARIPLAEGRHSIEDYAVVTDRHHAPRRRVTVTKRRRRESSRFRQHRTGATHEAEASRAAARHSSSPGRSKLPLETHGDARDLRLRANPPRQFLTRLIKRLFLRALNRRCDASSRDTISRWSTIVLRICDVR